MSMGQWLTSLIWAGLACLTLALLLLMRTRWGQARPLSKCAVLSLFAHLLLAAYAYQTSFFVPVPGPMTRALTQPTRVRLDLTGDPSEQDDAQDTPSFDPSFVERAPWSETPPAVVVPPHPALAREAAMPDVVPGIDPTLSAGPAAEELPVDDLLPEPNDTAPPTVLDDSDGQDGASALPELPPAPLPAPPVVATPPTPPDEELPVSTRPAVQETPATDPLQRRPVPEVEDPMVEPPTGSASADEPRGDESLQRLVDGVATTETAEARSASEDALRESSNLASRETGQAAADLDGEATRLRDADAWQAVSVAGPAPVRVADGRSLPAVYRGRFGEERRRRALAGGGSEKTEQAIEDALQWLAAHQSADGRWRAADFGAGQERNVNGHDRGGAGADADTAMTGLALLALMGAGHTHFDGTYRSHVQHGLEFLLASQDDTGSLAGNARLFTSMYCHGIAFLAISEAFALTGDSRLRPYVERAQQFTLRSQIPRDGGWRYQPGDTQGDMSQFGWQVMALRSAELAGLPIPETARRRMLEFLSHSSSGRAGGLAAYRAGTRPTRTMTAEALTCRFFLDAPRGDALRQEAIDFLMQETPRDEHVNFYYWYYGTLALFQSDDARWAAWNTALQQQLLRRQVREGPDRGSWPPDTVWGGYGGRVYTTAMAALTLEVYYRYLPLYGPTHGERPPLYEAQRYEAPRAAPHFQR